MNKLFFLFLALNLVGCSQRMDIKSTYDPMVNFKGMKTYAIKPGTRIQIEDKRVNNDFLNSRIVFSIDQYLQKHGYQKNNDGNPDFWVSFDGALERKKKVETSTRFSGDLRDWGGDVEPILMVTHYNKGVLWVDVVNPQTDQTLYRGTAQAKIDLDVTWKEKEKRINKAVKGILKEFPPSP